MKTLYDQTPEILELILKKRIREKNPKGFKHLEKANAVWEDSGKTFKKITELLRDELSKYSEESLERGGMKEICRAYVEFVKLIVNNERFKKTNWITDDETKSKTFRIALEAMRTKELEEKIKECEQISFFLKDEHINNLKKEKERLEEEEEKKQHEELLLMNRFREKALENNEVGFGFDTARSTYLGLTNEGYREEGDDFGQQKAFIILGKADKKEERIVNKNALQETKILFDRKFFPFKTKKQEELRQEMVDAISKHVEHASTARMVYNYIADNIYGAIQPHYELVFEAAVKDLKKQYKTKTLDSVKEITNGNYTDREIEVQGNHYNRDEFINTYIKLRYTARVKDKGINITEVYNNECNKEFREKMTVLKILKSQESGIKPEEYDYITAKSKFVEEFSLENEELLKRLAKETTDKLALMKLLKAKYKFGEITEREAKILVNKIAEKKDNIYKSIFLDNKLNKVLNRELLKALINQIELEEEMFANIDLKIIKDFLINITDNSTEALQIMNKIKRKELANMHYILTEKKLPEEPDFNEREYFELTACLWTN